jgi:hypothetical protein
LPLLPGDRCQALCLEQIYALSVVSEVGLQSE